MELFLGTAFGFPTVALTVPLLVIALYWIVVAVGPGPADTEKKRRSSGRRPGSRKEHHKVLVLCEGETEDSYFDGLSQHLHEPLKPEHGSGRPVPNPVTSSTARRTDAKSIAKKALDRRDEGYSEIWAVFDTECEKVTPIRTQVSGTRCSRAEATVHTAVSHPAFEVWLLLHHLDRGGLNGCHDAESTERLLQRTVSGWAKGHRTSPGRPGTDFRDFAEGLDRACVQAARTPIDRYDGSPWTDVHRAVEAIRARIREAAER
ncbi:RloB family protein [Nocardiopsis sp. CNT312]|uniref:RloB family protein n=1 Tax=Nocardiopsis sp. CNT312 TaxID=1137268 RepID=UPI00048E2295|nr:RloB family protein [Nocardiopsis sp. CNT312]